MSKKTQSKSITSRRTGGEALAKQIVALKSNPAIKNQKQIAQILDITEETVCRHLKASKPELELAQKKLEEYSTAFGAGMGIAARAERYKELAQQSNSPAVALQTLIRIDDLAGITTEKDRLRAINLGDAQPQQGPMFLMAPGSTVHFGHASEPTHTTSSGKDDDDTQDVV